MFYSTANGLIGCPSKRLLGGKEKIVLFFVVVNMQVFSHMYSVGGSLLHTVRAFQKILECTNKVGLSLESGFKAVRYIDSE